MVFVINKLKYDTDKMTLVSDFLNLKSDYAGKNVKLWKSAKGNWLLTYEDPYKNNSGKAIDKEEDANLLLEYDLEKYEEIFGELEEA